MLYDYLVEFTEVARCGSIAKAAMRLSLSQPALSRHMDALENDLGVCLMARTERGCRLTPIGSEILDKATDIASVGERVRGLARSYARAEQESLAEVRQNLVFVGEMASAALPLEIGKVMARGFEGRLRPIFKSTDSLDDEPLERLLLERGRAEIVSGEAGKRTEPASGDGESPIADVVLLFAADERLRDLPVGLSTHSFMQESFYIAMRPDNPLASRKSLCMRDLREQVFVFPRGHFLHSFQGWDEFRRICGLHGFSPKSTAMPFNDVVDMFSWNITTEVCPTNRHTPISHVFFEGDYACVPVKDERYPHIVAVYREGDKEAELLVNEVAREQGCRDICIPK